VQHALKEGLRIIVCTGGISDGIGQSLARLGVKEYHFSVKDKSAKLDELIASTGLNPARCAYMGDDIPDLRVMQRTGLPLLPRRCGSRSEGN
jgi:3-deoxy-D-manno-octulosonate 8-phosphate phosphatase (KDO 8-P phosphatase)